MNVGAIMQAIADAMESGSVVTRCYAYPAEAASTNEAVVGYPERLDFDLTFQRGADRGTFPVWVLCGMPSDAKTRDRLSAYVRGAVSVKTALDGNLAGTADDAVVTSCVIERYDPTGLPPVMAVRFDVDVIGGADPGFDSGFSSGFQL